MPITLIPTIKYNSIQPKVPLIVNNDPVMVLNDENVLETAHEPSAEQKLIKDPFVAERIRDGNWFVVAVTTLNWGMSQIF